MVTASRRTATRAPSAGALPRCMVLVALPVVLAVTAAACSSPKPAAGATSSPTAPAAASPASSPSASSSPVSGGGLSGTWSGRYSGAFQGTFTLRWTESGSKLSGRITLPSLGGAVAIHGTVEGNAIRFGTVGSTAIQYSGSVSGNSMSGSYKVETSGGSSGGPWSASRSS